MNLQLSIIVTTDGDNYVAKITHYQSWLRLNADEFEADNYVDAFEAAIETIQKAIPFLDGSDADLMKAFDCPQLLTDIAESMDFKVRPYSGRNMYGKYCMGIGVDNESEYVELVHQAKSRGIEGAVTDQLGLGLIVYWPDIDWPEDWEIE